MAKIKRPQNLDERVIFCDEFAKRIGYIHRNQLLHLRISYNGHKKFKWTFEFDIADSGDVKSQIDITFTKDEFIQIINIFESKPFDWRFRQLPESYPYLIYYYYLNLEDVVEVANKVTDYAYSLYNDVRRKHPADNLYQLRSEEERNNKEFRIFIRNYVNKKYELCFSQKTPEVSILFFKNGRMITKNGKKNKFELMDIIQNYNYSYQQAIEEYNPDRKDGVLLIFYEQRKAEFYEMEWNEFCLMIDKRVFYTTDSEDDFWSQFIIDENEEKTDDLTEVNLFPDEIIEEIQQILRNEE